MPPKRQASTAFKPPQSKAKALARQSRPKATTTGRPRAKFIPAPDPSSSASESTAGSSEHDADDNDDDDDDDEEQDPSAQDSSAHELSSSMASASPVPLARRPAPAPTAAASSSRPDARPRSPTANPDESEGSQLPVMPEKLLTALLYLHFQQAETKIGRDARDLVGKYVETFVREAIARAIVERKGVAGGGGDFLEVEDLEKLAPQLILDF